MKIFYNVEIMMKANEEINDEFMESASRAFQFLKTDIDEIEKHRVVAVFMSDIKPTEMRERARKFLKMSNDLGYFKKAHYVDVVYRFEYEMNPDRFVIWSNGDVQEYTGHVIYTEDDE